jgi:Protein of unknown function (DUF3485)
MNPNRIGLLLSALFFLAVGGAWGWFHISPREFPFSYRFIPVTQIQGWKYTEAQVTQAVIDTLATTNLVNGSFSGAKGEKFTVFLGTWDGRDSKQLSVVAHSPDVCWVGAGWKPVVADLPDKINIRFGTNEIPFEVSLFEAPGGGFRELTVWCTLVGGQVYEERGRFIVREAGNNERRLSAEGARHGLRSRIVRAVGDRIPGSGTKQFARFSMRAEANLQASITKVTEFGTKWLALEEVRSKTP